MYRLSSNVKYVVQMSAPWTTHFFEEDISCQKKNRPDVSFKKEKQKGILYSLYMIFYFPQFFHTLSFTPFSFFIIEESVHLAEFLPLPSMMSWAEIRLWSQN